MGIADYHLELEICYGTFILSHIFLPRGMMRSGWLWFPTEKLKVGGNREFETASGKHRVQFYATSAFQYNYGPRFQPIRSDSTRTPFHKCASD